MMYRAWYELDGHEVPARGKHGSICFTPATLTLVKRAAERNGHALTRIVVIDHQADQIIAEARKHLGEHEIPPGSNRGPQVDQWLDRVHCPRGNPWCAAYASAMLADAGLPLIGGGSAGCATLRERAIAHGLWLPITKVQPGYLAIVAGDKHVVIVIGRVTQGIRDIAGNTSAADGKNYNGGQVAEHYHAPSVFSGCIKTY